MDTIAKIGRRVYMKSTVADWTVPKATDLYWLLDLHPDTDGIDGTGDHRPEVRYIGGRTSIMLKSHLGWKSIQVPILNADGTRGWGETQAAIVYSYDVPCPKVRKGIEVRWYQGKWQKYTKARGWEDLPIPLMVPRDDQGVCVGCKGSGKGQRIRPDGETEEISCPTCGGIAKVPELSHKPASQIREGT
jgi:ssDNA-binding Zn-finger/Zn-ribbon topoisomerase 1